MDKPIIQSHGLGLYRFKPKYIIPFLEDISEENIKELEVVYDIEPLEALVTLINREMVFAVVRDDKPLAITGVDESGMMWSLFSKSLKKNWVRFARASPDLINFYHHFYEVLTCQVWSQNDVIMQWLAHLDFEPDMFFSYGNVEMAQFVRCKTEQTNVYSLLSRPVMH